MSSAPIVIYPRCRLRTHLLTLLTASAAITSASSAQDLHWNGGAESAIPAAGGTGIWSNTNAWRIGPSGLQTTWSAGANGTNNAFLGGNSGTITLGTSGSVNFTGGSMSVTTSGYTIASSSGSRNLIFTGTLSLSNDVALTFDQNNTGSTWAFGNLSLGPGAILRVQGGATVNNANRVNLTAGTSSGGSITLAGTGAGPTGFVATSAVTLNINVLNNSTTSATMLGATSGQSLSYGGILSGSAHLQISAGASGGAGIVTLSNQNLYQGDTYLNANTNGVTRIGVDNALPSSTTVFFGQSASGGSADTGGSLDLNGRALAVAALESATMTRGVANNSTTASTLTIGKASGTNTFGGVIGLVTNTNLTTQNSDIDLVKLGASTQVLEGTNTFTGSTTISAGSLALSGSGSINASSGVSVASGATFTHNSSVAFTSALTLTEGASLAGSGVFSPTGLTISGDLSDGRFTAISLGASTLELPDSLALLFSNLAVGTFSLFNGSIGGSFTSVLINSTTLDASNGFRAAVGEFEVLYLAENNALQVIPEPSAFAPLAGLTAFGVAALRRRTRA
jgi:fibronectin-binding autotransporter adhesin